MKTKLMNILTNSLSSILLLSLIITIVAANQTPSIKEITQREIIAQVNEEAASSPIQTESPATTQETTETFTITSVIINNPAANNEYNGQSTTSDSGIFFTSDEVMSVGEIVEGDQVVATFDSQGELLGVKKVEVESNTQACEQGELQAEDGSCVPESFYNQTELEVDAELSITTL